MRENTHTICDERPEQGMPRTSAVVWVIGARDDPLATPQMAAAAGAASIYQEQRFSDHAPLTLEYDDRF